MNLLPDVFGCYVSSILAVDERSVGFLQYLLSYWPREAKRAIEHPQNAQIEMISRMCKVSFEHLLSIYTFCRINAKMIALRNKEYITGRIESRFY